jgi:hypothetical protein
MNKTKPQIPVAAEARPTPTDAEITRLKCEVYDLSQEVANLQKQAEMKVRAIQEREQRIATLTAAKHTNGAAGL